MSRVEFTTVDRILSKLFRDLKGTDINEGDVISWIGEALEFLRVHQVLEEIVSFLVVKDYHAEIPFGFQSVLQIARDRDFSPIDDSNNLTTDEIEEEGGEEVLCPVPIDCQGKPLTDYKVAYYRPFYDLKWEYQGWTNSTVYRRRFTPVRLANHSFFNNIVCKERNEELYRNCEDEYTIVGTTQKRLRFSFREGAIAISYQRNALDSETGYPLVPDDIRYITAITYYIKLKLSERMRWHNREGSVGLVEDSRKEWLRYAKQAKNYMKMPKTIDDYQDLLEETHQLIPKMRRYYNYFGNLGRMEHRKFNDPDNRNKFTRTRYGR